MSCCLRLLSTFTPFIRFENGRPDKHDGVVTHPEPDILDCEVKGLKEVLLLIKLVEVMEFSAELFKNPKR